MEKTVKFEQYQAIKAHALAMCGQGKELEDPKTLNPILLAYIGDVVFSLYVRMRLLPTSGQIRVIHAPRPQFLKFRDWLRIFLAE